MTPLQYAETIAYSSKETLHFTYETAKRLANLPGIYVECGVAAGAQIIAMAHGAPDKIIYAFDSFQGIPMPSNKDDQYPGIRFISETEQKALPNPGEQVLESSGATVVSEETFWYHIDKSGTPLKNIITVPGWFEHTTQLFGKLHNLISFLRLDGDLYNSTKVCLENLYPNVISGGVVVVDDFALHGSYTAVFDYFASINVSIMNLSIRHVNGKNIKDGAYFIKP